MVKVRFFGSSDCRDCMDLFVTLNKAQVEYEYIDTLDMSDEVQAFCDEHKVDLLPHVQFLDVEGKIVIEHVGPLDENRFIKYLMDYFPQY